MPSTSTDRLNGLKTSVAIKAPCRVATVANITLYGEQTIDGVAVEEGDRVLVMEQDDLWENGIYVVSTGAWARAKDFDGNRDAVQGTIVLVSPAAPGTLFYELQTPNPVVIGTSDIEFEAVDAGVETVLADLADPSSASNGAGQIGFNWALLYAQDTAGWAIKTATQGVNLLRYIPPAQWAACLNYTSTYDATADIQAWIDNNRDRFAPAGLFRYTGNIVINSASSGGGQGVIRGAGMDRTIFRAMTNATAKFSNSTERHDNIHLRDLSIDANNIGTNCLALGVDGSIGTLAASSADIFDRVKFVQAVGDGVVLEYCQYCDFNDCIITSNGGYGVYLNDSALITLNRCLFTSNRCGMYFGGANTATNPSNFSACNTITLNQCKFYGPYSGSAEGYLHFDNAYNINMYSCYFEHEISHSQPLVRIGRNGTAVVTAEINFENCVFNGIPYNNDIVSITYGQRIRFKKCTSFKPNAGFYIVRVNDAHASVEIESCRVNNGSYSTFNAELWSEATSALLVSAGKITDMTLRTGTATAVITDTTNNATMSATTCYWTRKGRELTISGNVSTTALGSVTGNVYLGFTSGLSFTALGSAGGNVGSTSGLAITAGQSVAIAVNNGDTRLSLMLWDATTGTTRLQASEWTDDGNISFTMTFPVSTI